MRVAWKCVMTVLLGWNGTHFAAAQEQRQYRALVIGNQAYDKQAVAWGAGAAGVVASRLEERRFAVSRYENVTLGRFHEYLTKFASEIRPRDVVVFYFAGKAAAGARGAALAP